MQRGQLVAARRDRALLAGGDRGGVGRACGFRAGVRELAVEARDLVPRGPQQLGAAAQRELRALGLGGGERGVGGGARGRRVGEGAHAALRFREPGGRALGGGEAGARRGPGVSREHELGLGGGAGVVGEDRDRERGAVAGAELLLDEGRARVRGDRQARVDLRARHALEQLGALAALGFQERGEVALCEQRGAAELVERQAEPAVDLAQRLGLGAAEALAIDHAQRHLIVLEAAVERVAGAAHLPAGAVAARIAGLEVDLGPAGGRAAAQQGADVLRAERGRIVLASADDDRAAVREARRALEQRDAHRIEQRGLAGARRPDDREHARRAERTLREIDLELSGEASEVAAADREDLHGTTSGRGAVRIIARPPPRRAGARSRRARRRTAARRGRAPTGGRTRRAGRARRGGAR